MILMEIINLFPQPVGISNINRKLTPEEFFHILTQQRVNNPDNQNSINDTLLDDEKLSNLKSEIEKFLNEYFQKVYCPPNDVEIYITQSWSNYTNSGSHYKHNHSNSFISGVFYVNAYQNDVIEFSKLKDMILNITPTEYNIWNTEDWIEPVETGKIILFPSKLVHGVPYRGEVANSERISIAFNTFLRGNIGMRDHKTQLILK
jgi:uncharacterized protein (TIGR02466 family)